MSTVSEVVATAVASLADDVFALMGNGNAYLLDALARTPVRVTTVRHEAATVASADAYHRVSGRLAVATTTYGPGFTNTITSLAEAAQAATPLVLVVGDAPAAGPRPWDVDQIQLAAAVGAVTMVLDAAAPGRTTVEAAAHALAHRVPVVLALPYDLATAPAADDDVPAMPLLPEPVTPDPAALAQAVRLLQEAERPLVLAGRGAKAAAAQLRTLADRLGALTATSAPARGLFAGRPYDLGVCGGFASEPTADLVRRADVVLVVGAGLNQFTTSFGSAFAPGARVVQVDVAEGPTHPVVGHYVRGDAALAVLGLLDSLDGRPAPVEPWGGAAAEAQDGRLQHARPAGDDAAPDGRLDPRTVTRRLDALLPANRLVVCDGGHFIGWPNTYLELPAADSITLVGTAFQAIGLGFPSAPGAAVARPDALTVVVTGDGGGLMGLADLDTLVRCARSALVVVFNDAAYGAEVHQYGSQGLDRTAMAIDEIDFATIARGLGAAAATIDRLEDLRAVEEWLGAGALGTFLADLRVSQGVVAPYIQEIVERSLSRR
ncbi:thiamine pyrophosphate-binding protein [Georgenia thermotolerans]|uniref:Thiamine pyrophosphate-binding protein n=1 Tax=Georgenia thermotolerans TaxID=527326 RepID=A0A7J5UU71_9MICO|nr:thiamine pyrophosphate-binding protein [Georgenia thermotolerans]KAE8765835.1 thiamine pyrophosphate-binding protein [Georgenia thermotolerans]